MAKVELKGSFLAVLSPVEKGEKKTMIQTVFFKVPGYRDEYGDQKGNDEIWEFSVVGIDNINKLALDVKYEGKKAKCSIYLNSNTIDAKPATATEAAKQQRYIINAVLYAFILAPQEGEVRS